MRPAIKFTEFLPAPGQFVNENYTAVTMAEACAYAENRMAQTAYVSLGGFGGCLVVGFDHSIDNDGDYNIAVTGNPFDGSSEPGIVWVMQDENGDRASQRSHGTNSKDRSTAKRRPSGITP